MTVEVPAPATSGEAEYVRLLWEARMDAGFPPYRDIAAKAGLSHTNIHVIFKGITRPRLDTLTALANALTDDPTRVDEIINAYRALPRPTRTHPATPPPVVIPLGDAKQIVAAIGRMSAAVTDIVTAREETDMDERDRELSGKISPASRRPVPGLRTLYVKRLRAGLKAVLRRGLRSDEFSVYCETCGWQRWGDSEPPFEWVCPSCDGLYRMEFAIYGLVKEPPM